MKQSEPPHARPRRLLPRRSFNMLVLLTASIAFIAATSTPRVAAETYAPDSVHRGMNLLFIGFINPDCFADSVYGVPDATLSGWLPSVVIWGRPTSGVQPLPPGGADCFEHIPDALKRSYTLFTYPTWASLHGSVSFLKVNPDSLTDLFIAIRGRVGSGSQSHDTLRRILIFGQSALDTIAAIPIGSLADFATYPCIAMSIRDGLQLVNPAVRDLSGTRSWEFPGIPLVLNQTDTTQHNAPPALPATVRVYPNPAVATANVEARTLAAGTYSVEIVATNGAVAERQTVEIMSDGGDFLRALDVSRLASGYYVVRIVRAAQLVGNYPIVIAR